MENNTFAQLSNDKLEEITALENKLGVILIAYDTATATNQMHKSSQSISEINPS
ncbi:hypothetical protein AAGS61_11340 [Lysinibacillus sp. KU-BSD001]|uniref:hypothetical protein n=1 Tax=Lysinibacillus sp. KU-BSD001 TaxID=3141328 RepID=UPI0036EB19B5